MSNDDELLTSEAVCAGGMHIPVLPDEVVRHLGDPGRRLIADCTVGLGGHAALLLAANPALQIIALDRDETNLQIAREALSAYGDRIRIIHANFAELPRALREAGLEKVDGLLADLGISSNQIADPTRGLSFERDGPLDMRLDRREKTTAADLVNTLSEGELSDLLYFQSQERHSRKIAKRICQVRRQGRINSTVLLSRLVAAAMGENPDAHRGKIHPATRTFMALRMSVNRETESLQEFLAAAPECLNPGGRIAVISFHSVEDRVVKEDFRDRGREGLYAVLTKKPIVAEETEREHNPRSRSAKMRVAERLAKA
ncbi:MAG TPA: 16S rRNA (cytosine(1402)-N(4))-methyltransferase RsmH [Phycisphaerae bacterium]|nr:16S rRNA (cytosine(1402)-N(4))-methyltransferase RsmH [Phycisphaerae bacterium]